MSKATVRLNGMLSIVRPGPVSLKGDAGRVAVTLSAARRQPSPPVRR